MTDKETCAWVSPVFGCGSGDCCEYGAPSCVHRPPYRVLDVPAAQVLEEVMPKGFTCLGCGAWQDFGAYVAAHWNVNLHHRCDACGTTHGVLRGSVLLLSKGASRG